MIYNDEIKTAVKLIKQGEVVGMPTETVYGLAADACNQEACQKIYSLKRRPLNNPLIVHVHDLESAKSLADFNDNALKLTTLWPGPLTMVLPQTKRLQQARPVADCVTAGLSTIAIRIPAHELALEFIRQTCTPIAAPSANISGRISPIKKQHVRSNFTEDQLYILGKLEDQCKYGLESTIIDLTTEVPTLLRYGFITPELLSEILGQKVVIHQSLTKLQEQGDLAIASDKLRLVQVADKKLEVIKAPGMSYRHYAPQTKLRLNASYLGLDEIGLTFGDNGFVLQEHQISIEGQAQIHKNSSYRVMNLSQSADLAEAARNLFDYLHILDELAMKNNYQAIVVAPIPNRWIGLAINDRLQRAAEE